MHALKAGAVSAWNERYLLPPVGEHNAKRASKLLHENRKLIPLKPSGGGNERGIDVPSAQGRSLLIV